MTAPRAARRSRRRGHPAGSRRDDGYVVALTALLLVPLLLASALAVDVGTWYARITQLQRAADAAALAGTIWMPDLNKATAVANDSLAKNGIVDGVDGISVTIGPGSTSTSLKVSIREAKTDAYFSQVIGWTQSLSRSAEAEYFLPLPLGSPLNYFGGDASKNGTETTTDPPSDATTNKPTNSQQCRFKGGTSKGYSNGNYTTKNIKGTWAECTWEVGRTDQIDPNQSPGFWAVVAGPGTVAARGDAFSSRCAGSSAVANCSSVSNEMYRSGTDAGYWYVIRMPKTGASTTTVSIYDAGYYKGDSGGNAGDIGLDGSSNDFTTQYQLYKQDSPLDFNARTALPGCSWQLTTEAQYKTQWQDLCTISSPANGSVYLLNVKTSSANNQGSGLNGYAVKAVSANTAQPAVSAYSDMAMDSNLQGGSASFYLAEVGPEFAGKVLSIELFDAGDFTGNGKASVYPMMPSTSAVGPVVNVPSGSCTYTASPSPNTAYTGTGGWVKTGDPVTTAHASDTSGKCSVLTYDNTKSKPKIYNDEWLRIRVKVPDDYTCTKGLNPVTKAGSCWWGINYTMDPGVTATEVTTWRAAIEGNPVHLVE